MSTPLVNNTTYYASQTVYGIESLQRLPVTAMAALSTAENTFAGFTYYPNPVKDVLTLSNSEEIEEVVVYNLLGQTALKQFVASGNAQINLSALADGMYVVKIMSEEQEKIFKIVKE